MSELITKTLYKGVTSMNLETKEIYVGNNEKKKEEILLRQLFGWKYVKDSIWGRSHMLHIILERDKDMKNYLQLDKLEKQYDKCKGELKTYYPITDSPEMFLLILLFIFPFVIYCLYKSGQKQRIAENNAELQKKMTEILRQAKELL